MTKFHHYVLPAIPGLAIVVGCFLDDLLARKAWRTGAAAVVVGLPLLLLITLDLTVEQARRRAVPLALLLRLRAEPDADAPGRRRSISRRR